MQWVACFNCIKLAYKFLSMWRVHHNSSDLGVGVFISPYEKCETFCSDFAMNFLPCEACRQGHYQNRACTQLTVWALIFNTLALRLYPTLNVMLPSVKSRLHGERAHLFHICHHSWALKYPVCCYIIFGIPTISINLILDVSFCKFDYVKDRMTM